MRLILALGLALLTALPALPARADVDAVLDRHILPRMATFAASAGALAEAAGADCRPGALAAPYATAFDAWMGVSHLQLGPMLEDGRGHAIAFWPDSRGATPATLRGLIAAEDPIVDDPADFARLSVAGRGLFALERMLYDPAFNGYETGSYSCALTRALATDLAREAAALRAGWVGGFADLMRHPGGDNTTFLTETEVAQALFTQLLAGLDLTEAQRVDRPLGTFERPRPKRAEARLAGRSLRNVVLSLEALRELADTLADSGAAETDAAFDRALAAAGKITDPGFANVGDPQERFKLEALKQRIETVRQTAQAEIGPQLGVAAGFNSSDGD